MVFPMRLRELRVTTGMTLKGLGSVLGLAESTMSGYENGFRKPDAETLVKIADHFGVSTDYLLGRKHVPTEHDKGEEAFMELVRFQLGVSFFTWFDGLSVSAKSAFIDRVKWLWKISREPL